MGIFYKLEREYNGYILFFFFNKWDVLLNSYLIK